MSSSVQIDNKRKDILILGEEPTQVLDDTTLTALSLLYDRSNRLLFANTTKVYYFKPKEPEIKEYTLCLGNISKYFTINNMKKED